MGRRRGTQEEDQTPEPPLTTQTRAGKGKDKGKGGEPWESLLRGETVEIPAMKGAKGKGKGRPLWATRQMEQEAYLGCLGH